MGQLVMIFAVACLLYVLLGVLMTLRMMPSVSMHLCHGFAGYDA